MATAPPRDDPNDDIGLVLIELLLSDLNGLLEVVIGQLGIEDLVPVLNQVGRFDATGN